MSLRGAFQRSLEFHATTETLERLKQFVCALIPFLALFAQRFADNLLKLGRSVREVTRERRWFLLKNRKHRFSWRVAGNWRMPRYHFVQHYAQTPNIGSLINLPAARLVRPHVMNRP